MASHRLMKRLALKVRGLGGFKLGRVPFLLNLTHTTLHRRRVHFERHQKFAILHTDYLQKGGPEASWFKFT